MSSTFDINSFLDATTTEQSKRRPPLTEGDYTAVIGDLAFRQVPGTKDPSKLYTFCDIKLTVDVPYDEQQRLELTSPTLELRAGFSVDLKADGRSIDFGPGKSAGLRRWREATGLNVEGQQFRPRDFTGKVVTVKIGHEEYPEGSGEYSERVVGVASAG